MLATRGDLAAASYYLERSVRLGPQDADTRTNYAVTLAGLNRLEEAQQQIEAVLKQSPHSPEAHNLRGRLLEQTGNPDGALDEFLEAVRLQPNFASAHLNAARILASKGNKAAAESHLRQAVAASRK